MFEEAIQNISVVACMVDTCAARIELAQMQYSMMNSIRWGSLLTGLGVFMGGISVLYKELRERSGLKAQGARTIFDDIKDAAKEMDEQTEVEENGGA